eukprot:GILJ01006397.1.p1 GENE.GILJ01006397.1~~GILJ01006397.1.p1  ORF type:complete len:498 (+),score=76.50 GILJ01006397.1:30-1496(+)
MKHLLVLCAVAILCSGAHGADNGVFDAGHLKNKLSPSARIALPGDAEYIAAVTLDNSRIQKRPLAVVLPTETNDIVETLLYTQKLRLPFSVRGGGHSAAGYSLNDGGIVLYTAWMNKTVLNPVKETLYVEAGVVWKDLYEGLVRSKSEFIPVAGGCSTVGVAGFTLGGGYSWLSRSYGMAIDNLLSVTMVSAAGQVVHLNGDSLKSEQERDLWWALRGGGGGNFGVMIDFTFKVYKKQQPKIVAGDVCFRREDWIRGMKAYDRWANEMSNASACYGRFALYGSERLLCIGYVHNGPLATGMKELTDFIIREEPYSSSMTHMDFNEWELHNGVITAVAGNHAYIKSGVIPDDMSDELIHLLVEMYDKAPSNKTMLQFVHLRGKMSQVPATATAYWHRKAKFVYQTKSVWRPEEDSEPHMNWAAELGQRIAPYLSGAYVNYIDAVDIPDWKHLYYGKNYERLVQIKNQWDPENFFSFDKSIRPESKVGSF